MAEEKEEIKIECKEIQQALHKIVNETMHNYEVLYDQADL